MNDKFDLVSRRFIFFILAIPFLSGCMSLSTSGTELTNDIKIENYNVESLVTESLRKSELMVGNWYAKHLLKDDANLTNAIEEYIATLQENGRLEITFRMTFPDGFISEYTQVGTWGVSGDYMFTKIHTVIIDGEAFENHKTDPKYGYTDWLYKIVEISPHTFIYKTVGGNNTYREIKVDSKNFPGA